MNWDTCTFSMLADGGLMDRFEYNYVFLHQVARSSSLSKRTIEYFETCITDVLGVHMQHMWYYLCNT